MADGIDALTEMVRASTARSEENGRMLVQLSTDSARLREKLDSLAETMGGQGPSSMPARLIAVELGMAAVNKRQDTADERRWQGWLALAAALLALVLSWLQNHSAVTLQPAGSPPATDR